MRLLPVLLLLVLPAAIFAQNRASALADNITARLATALKLDSTQKKRVQRANEDFISGMQSALTGEDDRREKMQELKKLREAHAAAMENILTREQVKQYEALREEQQKRMAEAVAQRMSEEVTLKMQDKLNLSVRQSTQADSINTKSFRHLLDAVMEDTRGLEKLRALRAASEERNAGMKAILTAGQYKGYEEMNEEARKKMRKRG